MKNKILKINIHSVIDLITNSSTEIFVNCTKNSVKYLTEFIDFILKEAKSGKKATDLFTFKITREYYDDEKEEDITEVVDKKGFDKDIDEGTSIDYSLEIIPKKGTPVEFINLIHNMLNIDSACNG